MHKLLPIYIGIGHKFNIGKHVGQMKEHAARQAQVVVFLCLCKYICKDKMFQFKIKMDTSACADFCVMTSVY